MTKEDILHLANKNYNRLNEYERKELAKKTKNGAILGTIFLGIICLLFLIITIISFCNNSGNGVTWLSIFFGVVVGGIIFLSQYKFLAIHSEKEWALTHFENEIKKAGKLAKKGKATFEQIRMLHAEDVVAVSLVDKHTEITDKLHGFLNYQEIIQTRWYTFQIIFADDSVEIFETKENSKDCILLLSLIQK